MHEYLGDDRHIMANLLKDLVKLGCIRQAKEIFIQYKALFPGARDVYLIGAALAITENKFAEAERIAEQGLAVDSQNGELICQLADIYSRTGRSYQAIYRYRQAIDLVGDADLVSKITKSMEDIKSTSEYRTVQHALASILS